MMSRNRRKEYIVYTSDYSWRNWVPKYDWRKPNGSFYKKVKSFWQAKKLARKYGNGSDIVVKVHELHNDKKGMSYKTIDTFEYCQFSDYPPMLTQG